ncbi:MAG: radical SAM/SPASM domain-containing protein [Promethearchaeota archaeon]
MNKIIFGIIGVTYRCNARCVMCHTWKFPTKKNEEIDIKTISKLPYIPVINITGGEPFLRDDLEEIISILKKKSKRIVISTNGFFHKRIIQIAKKFPDIGIRISIEGLPKTNDELRGIKNGFDMGLRTLIELKSLGLKDIGFGITISDTNILDLLPLFKLAKFMKVEFATAIVHNSYYFHKYDNKIKKKEIIIDEFKKLICELLKSKRIKDWYRAYFNYGIINYIKGNKRLLPCEMGISSFYLDPFGEIRPCNVLEETMGNLKEKSFDEIWNGKEAERIRNLVRNCNKNCWMIGSVGELMKKYIAIPTKWIIKTKFLKHPI